MVFNSTTFLIFFIVFFFLYWWINNKMSVRFRNAFTIVASYIFYGWWDWRFLTLIVISSLSDFIIGLLMHKAQKKQNRKLLLLLSLFINLGILGFFKYFNFFIDSLNDLLATFSISFNTVTLNIILPVGISFYTFQTLSYTIDIYRKKLEPTKDIIAFFAFVSFFPQLVAGPIERASHLLKQFNERKTFSYNANVEGLRLVLWGLFKKIVIADNFGLIADSIFNTETHLSGLTIIFGAVFFALQIYADFSGYSDIAIGLSRMLGYDLKPNFKTPYFAKSISDFWHRWHISLSTWFRDYVYIPLGGSRRGNFRVCFNIFLTFLLSGLWHGANITFLIWGGLHGILLIIEKQSRLKLSNFITYPLVVMSIILLWIPFRAESFTHLQEYTASIVHFSSYSFHEIEQFIIDFSSIRFLVLSIILALFLSIEYMMHTMDFSEWVGGKRKILRIGIYYALIMAILFIGNFSVAPSFIYFQF